MFSHGMGPIYLRLLLKGLLVTLEISAGALAVGCMIGCVLGPMRGSSRLFVRIPVLIYVEVLRSIPLLIILYLVYYGVPAFFGLSIGVLIAGIVGQGVFAGAYITEIVHSGLMATPDGQYEAARAMNLSYVGMMRYVIAPQALRVMTPAMVGIFVGNVKDSSIASIIGLQELTQTALTIRSQTYSTWDVFGLLMALYLIVNFAVTFLGGRLERRLDVTIVRPRRRLLQSLSSGPFERRSL